MSARGFWVIVHRWAGLTLALFLAVAGVTGAVLAFHDELEVLTAPHLHRAAPPTSGAAILAPRVLRAHVLERFPGATIDYLPLRFEPGRTVILAVSRLDPATGARSPWSRDWDELFVDPYTGKTVGQRRYADPSQGVVNLIPFLYRLHYSFAVGRYGTLAFGIAALVWTLDCFIGLYLTFPLKARSASAPSWPRRWKPAWRVRWRGGPHKLTFDLHRAGGLWIWPMLLVFAWSGVFFNLTPVYRPVMGLFGYQGLEEGIRPPDGPRWSPRLDFPHAQAIGEALARQEMARRGLTVDPSRETGLLHRPDAGVYAYIFSSSADMRLTGGRSLVIFDSDDGEVLKVVVPQGQNGANTLTEWLSALHMADVWGLPWRLAVSAMGLLVTMLSVTGVMIWARKRSARLLTNRKASARS